MSGIDRYLIRVLRMLMDWYDIWRGRVNGACVYVAREREHGPVGRGAQVLGRERETGWGGGGGMHSYSHDPLCMFSSASSICVRCGMSPCLVWPATTTSHIIMQLEIHFGHGSRWMWMVVVVWGGAQTVWAIVRWWWWWRRWMMVMVMCG